MTTAPPKQWTCPWFEFGEIAQLPNGHYLPTHCRGVYWEDSHPEVHIELSLEIRDDTLVTTRWTISTTSGDGVANGTLSKIDWKGIEQRVIAKAAWESSMGYRESVVTVPPEIGLAAEQAALAHVGRRAVTDGLLRQVADVARANPAKPTLAIAEQLHTSHRNATRWIAAARKRGFLIDGFSEVTQ